MKDRGRVQELCVGTWIEQRDVHLAAHRAEPSQVRTVGAQSP